MKVKTRVLPMILAFAMVIALLPVFALPVQAASPYNAGDAAVLNAIITSNGLTTDPSDANYRDYAIWEDDGTELRITQLFLNGAGLVGKLDLTGLTELKYLNCDSNQLTELDVSNNPLLETLYCERNLLTELDVSNNPLLGALICSNLLTELDISNNPLLTLLHCNNNKLTELDISNNPLLAVLQCYNNELTELDVSNNPLLKILSCSSNLLTKLDVSNNTSLETLSCGVNLLTELDVSNNASLEFLSCVNNLLNEIDVSNNTLLKALYCSSSSLTNLDVSNNALLEALYCGNNKLTELDVSNNSLLIILHCNDNKLTELDVSKNTLLENLDCSNNLLTALDVSKNKALWVLRSDGNNMTANLATPTDNSNTTSSSDSDDGNVYNLNNTVFTASSGATSTPSVAAPQTSTRNGRFRADNVVGNAVTVRISVPEGTESGLNFTASLSGTRVETVTNHFLKWFDNNISVIHFDQIYGWGQAVQIAAKLDLSGMDTDNLVFYSYDIATNTYRRIQAPAYWVDANGYLRFTTELAGDIIVSEGALVKK